MIRPGRADEAERMREIEREAGRRFVDVGMPDIAAAEPMVAEELGAYGDDGRCWVAVEPGGAVVGYVVVDVLDGFAHVEQLSVHPDHQGSGFGRDLLHQVEAWAGRRGLEALTLTTFRDVPWNRPLYEHLGFRSLAEAELPPVLSQVREAEAQLGLDPALRVVMRRDVRP